jgi:hypothetical protein
MAEARSSWLIGRGGDQPRATKTRMSSESAAAEKKTTRPMRVARRSRSHPACIPAAKTTGATTPRKKPSGVYPRGEDDGRDDTEEDQVKKGDDHVAVADERGERGPGGGCLQTEF